MMRHRSTTSRAAPAVALATVLAVLLLVAGCGVRLIEIEPARSDRSSTAWRTWDFPVYEKLEYEAAWNGVPAATFTVELVRDDVAGFDVVRARGETTGLASVAFPFEATAEATMPRGDPRGTTYVSRARLRGKDQTAEIRFDRQTGVAAGEQLRKGKTKAVAIADGARALDPLTMLYALRRTRLADGEASTFDVFPGEYLWRVTVLPIGRETIEVAAGEIEARKIVLRRDRLHREKEIEAQTSEAWISAGAERIPLKLVSNVPLGVLTIELVSREVADAPPPDWTRTFPDDRLPTEDEPGGGE